jgi:hypothetical protein
MRVLLEQPQLHVPKVGDRRVTRELTLLTFIRSKIIAEPVHKRRSTFASVVAQNT